MRHRSRTSVREAMPLFEHVRQHADVGEPGAVRPEVAPSGLRSVDGLLGGGFAVGSVTLVAARPKIGATSLLLGTSLAATRSGLRVAYFTEHLTEAQLRGRLVVLEARVNGHRFVAGLISAEDRIALAAARDRILWQSMSIVAARELEVDALAGHVFSYRTHLVIFDGLPRPPGAAKGPLRYAELKEGAEALAHLAEQHQVAVLWRLTLPRGEGLPSRDELPGKGGLAEHVSTLVLMHRDEITYPHVPGELVGVAEVHLSRIAGRDIPTELVRLRFDQRFFGLSDL